MTFGELVIVMEKINISKTIKGFAYAAGALVLLPILLCPLKCLKIQEFNQVM